MKHRLTINNIEKMGNGYMYPINGTVYILQYEKTEHDKYVFSYSEYHTNTHIAEWLCDIIVDRHTYEVIGHREGNFERICFITYNDIKTPNKFTSIINNKLHTRKPSESKKY